MENVKRHAWLWWTFILALVTLSLVLGFLQYRWIGAVSRAERQNLRETLEAGITRVSHQLNSELSAAASALLPEEVEADRRERERDYAAAFAQVKAGLYGPLVKREFLAVPEQSTIQLRGLDEKAGVFRAEAWPAGWEHLRAMLESRAKGEFPDFDAIAQSGADTPGVVEIPRFGPGGRTRGTKELEWIIVEFDTDHIFRSTLPALMQTHLGKNDAANYDLEVTAGPEHKLLFQSAGAIGRADASVATFDAHGGLFRGRRGRGNGRPPMAGPERGVWTLAVRHHAGSLEAFVEQARVRNLAVTGGILVLMMFAVAALVRLTRRSQRLAELQIQFVAGVSHELRTPLSVMRTAGHNLRGAMAADPEKVRKYGGLIEQQAESLGAIVEQVLSFARGKSGSPIGRLEPASVKFLIEEAVKAAGCPTELEIEPNLPLVLADATSLRHALQNLLTNAAKYGRPGDPVRVEAGLNRNGSPGSVEIRVRDRGEGIPRHELRHIFDPFYRGASAVAKQIHGTGLGLTITRGIIRAHRGTIAVKSEPGSGTEFTIRLEPAPAGDVK